MRIEPVEVRAVAPEVKRLSTWLLLICAAVLLVASCGKTEEPAVLEWVPEDAKYLGRIKSRAVLEDPGVQDIGIVESMFDMARVLDVGIDLKDFTEIWTFGESSRHPTGEGYFGMILVGAVQEGDLLNSIQDEGGALRSVNYKDSVIHITEDGKTALSFLETGAYVIGSISAVQDVIDVRRGDKRAINGGILDNFTSQGDRLLTLALEVPPGSLDTTLEPFSKIETVGFLLDKAEQNIFIEVSVDFSDEKSASQAAGIIDEVVGLAKARGGDEGLILRETEVSALETVMTIKLATTATDMISVFRPEVDVAAIVCGPDFSQDPEACKEQPRVLFVGFRVVDPGPPATITPFPVEGVMVTGDLNLIDMKMAVQARIKDLEAFAFKVFDPSGSPDKTTLRDAAEASLRKAMGLRRFDEFIGSPLPPGLEPLSGEVSISNSRARNIRELDLEVIEDIQSLMDLYGTGLEIIWLQVQAVDPPSQVQAAFDDAVRAMEDYLRVVNKAQAYQQDALPSARIEAEQIRIAAEASNAVRTIEAASEADRFLSILRGYDREEDEALKGLQLESLEGILPGVTQFILAAGSGLNRSVPKNPGNDFAFAGLWGTGLTRQVIPASYRWSGPGNASTPQAVGLASGQAQPIFIDQLFITLQETDQALVRRFGEVERVLQLPGVHLKVPFVENAILYDKRLLRFDAPPETLMTLDKESLIIDAYARYKIVDLNKFFETVGNEAGADSRLRVIISGELRKQIASYNLLDIIGTERDSIAATVKDQAARKVLEIGVEIVDVRIKRVDFPGSGEQTIFARMNAERKGQADKRRAEGEADAARIRAEADKQTAVILAEAQQQANLIVAEAEAVFVESIIQALVQDSALSRYRNALEAYKISKGLDISN